MNAIRKFLDKFKADKEAGEPSNSLLTNKVLLEELTAHFKTMLKSESVGKKMLYPMSFNILMDPEDYNARCQALPFVLPEVISAFYGIIEDMKKEYPDYTPPAKYWFFQFSTCQTNTIQSGTTPLLVRRGHLTTIATLPSFDIKNIKNTSIDSNTKVSIKLDDSNVMNDSNVNLKAISSLDIIGEGTFTCDFDSTLNQDTQYIKDNSNLLSVIGLAELSYSHGGKNYHYTMIDNLIHISGMNEMRKGSSFFKIEDADIQDSHVQIRYLPEKKKFQIAAFGPTRLNSGKMKESNGGNIEWYDLANNSSIFINDVVSVKFNIKE